MRELSILAAAAEHPSRECLVTDDRVWSYAELAGRVSAAIEALRRRGLSGGERVALTPRAELESALWLYAAFELGCPVVLLHPRLSKRERAQILDETEVALLISDAPPHDSIEAPELAPVPPERTLAIVYTSGSRGVPRGALLSRQAFVASEAAHATNLGWRPNDRWLLEMPPAHVGGLSILTRSLIARRCVVVSPGPFDPAETIAALERHHVTLLSVVPTMLRRLLQLTAPSWTPNPELRAVLVGGAPWPERLREEARARGVPALATYGCTEACSQVATQSMAQLGTLGSGAPLPGIELRIEDGEVQVRGDALMDGYLGQLRKGSAWSDDGWFRTGDLGAFLPDGQLVVRGRRDDLIITGGENVAPQEVEAWLESLPGVASACVFAVADETWGSAVAAAIIAEGPRFDPGSLRERARDGLADYKRPKWIAMLDAFPLNRSGKVDRAAVAECCEGKLDAI